MQLEPLWQRPDVVEFAHLMLVVIIELMSRYPSDASASSLGSLSGVRERERKGAQP